MSKPASGAVAPISNRITVIDGQPTTTSLDLAEVFGKRHNDVLRIVRQRMEEAGEWRLRNFTETVTTRENPAGGQPIESPVIRMTEKGFLFVVQKFTGKKAVASGLTHFARSSYPRPVTSKKGVNGLGGLNLLGANEAASIEHAAFFLLAVRPLGGLCGEGQPSQSPSTLSANPHSTAHPSWRKAAVLKPLTRTTS